MSKLNKPLLNGSGSGDGSGYGYGYGSGSGSGSGDGYGYGYGYGYGSGSGSGSGNGSGDGSGSGNGSGLSSFNNNKVYYIDKIPTVIKTLRRGVAKGFIVNGDLTTDVCYIARKGNYFAHGKTIKVAVVDAINKQISNMGIDDKILKFKDNFKPDKKYSGHEFSKWHYILTGSCEMGRDNFCKNNNIDLDLKYSTKDFIALTESAYGGEIVKKLVD